MTHYDPAQILLWRATHFERADWQWTRDHKIKHIRRDGDYAGYHHPVKRVQRLIKRRLPGAERRATQRLWAMLREPTENRTLWEKVKLRWWGLQAEVAVTLLTDSHLPDGHLANAGVIAYWEEDGEYLQMVQPSVGKMLAEFLMEEPEHPHAKKILAELRRIEDDYSERAKAGLVDGRKTDA